MSFRPRVAGLAGSAILAGALLSSCSTYGKVEQVPLADDLITLRDRFFDVATKDGRRVIVVGYGGKILASRDGGEHWERVAAPTDKTLLRIRFADEKTGWIVGQDGTVLRTEDGGETWQAQSSGTDSHLFGLAVLSPTSAFACGDRSRWIQTRDGGATWTGGAVALSDVGMNPEIALAVREPIYYDAAFLDESTGWIVGDYGNIRFTADGGRSWQSQHGSLLGQSLPGYMRPLRDALDLPALFRIAMRDREHGVAAGVGGIVLETADGGKRWTFLDTGIRPRVEVPLLEIAFVSGGTLLFGGSGVALREEAGHWQRFDLGLPLVTWVAGARLARAGDLSGQRGFAVGGRGLILRTDDAGRTWQSLGANFASPRVERASGAS